MGVSSPILWYYSVGRRLAIGLCWIRPALFGGLRAICSLPGRRDESAGPWRSLALSLSVSDSVGVDCPALTYPVYHRRMLCLAAWDELEARGAQSGSERGRASGRWPVARANASKHTSSSRACPLVQPSCFANVFLMQSKHWNSSRALGRIPRSPLTGITGKEQPAARSPHDTCLEEEPQTC